MSTETQKLPFETDDDIEIVRLVKWLDYASGYDPAVSVALPLIQRGSVWKQKQIIDLWDTLLRGMPLGSLMYSQMPKDSYVRKINEQDMEKITSSDKVIGLIDGQQRTLAMLIAWTTSGEKMDRRIWVDFADIPSDEHLFRLHVTTKNQPFGFQKSAPFTKLSLTERNDARIAFEGKFSVEKPSQEYLFEHAQPFLSKRPIDLKELIGSWKITNSKALWVIETEEELKRLSNGEDLTNAKSRIIKFADALEQLFKLQIPLLKVNPDFFRVNDDEITDPPLAVLFKRIGTGGTPLTDADYVYSVIKHRLPQTYPLVTNLHKTPTIARLLSATDLVMTAVRLAAAEYAKPMTDWESPTKQNFHSLIKRDGQNADFLKINFLPLIESGALNSALTSLTKLLEYDDGDNSIGLPPHAFPLLNRPLVQVLLRWIRCTQLKELSNLDAILSQSKEEVLRFVMYWQLCVTEPRKASRIAFEHLKDGSSSFPGKEIYCALLKEQLAISILSPKTILETNSDVVLSPPSIKLLRGWKRFIIQQEPNETQKVFEDKKHAASLYQRWWGNGKHYVHPILLWLQRQTVNEFDGSPVAGRDEDTPYDYDHICPANHWSNWTGETGSDTLIVFLAKDGDGNGHQHVGNSIGNLRVWDSSKNRSDGKSTPSEKLKLGIESERDKLLKQSAIDSLQIVEWEACSGEKGKSGRSWNETRAVAFQRVVEQRAFALYKRFYDELDFYKWPEKQLEVKETL